MRFKGILLYPKPTYGAVKRVETVMTDWLFANIPLNALDPKQDLEKELMEYLKQNPRKMADFYAFEEDAEYRKIIMLGANKTFDEAILIENKLSYHEYEMLVSKIKDMLKIDKVKDFLTDLKSATSIQQEETAVMEEIDL